MREKNQYYQNIFIEFSDGKEIVASVPAFEFLPEKIKALRAVRIQVTRPKKLSNDEYFETLR